MFPTVTSEEFEYLTIVIKYCYIYCYIFIGVVQKVRHLQRGLHEKSDKMKHKEEGVQPKTGCLPNIFSQFQGFQGVFFPIFWLFFKVFRKIFAHFQGSSKNSIRMFISIYRFRKLPNEH